MIHRHRGEAHKTHHYHCYLLLTFPLPPLGVSHGPANLTRVRITVWTVTQYESPLSRVPRKREALWDQILLCLWALLPIIYSLHSVVACADIKLIQNLWLFQGLLTIPHPAQICAIPLTSRENNRSKSVLGIGELSGHSFFCLNYEFQPFSSRQDAKNKTKSSLPLLHRHILIHPGVSLCTACFSVS